MVLQCLYEIACYQYRNSHNKIKEFHDISMTSNRYYKDYLISGLPYHHNGNTYTYKDGLYIETANKVLCLLHENRVFSHNFWIKRWICWWPAGHRYGLTYWVQNKLCVALVLNSILLPKLLRVLRILFRCGQDTHVLPVSIGSGNGLQQISLQIYFY